MESQRGDAWKGKIVVELTKKRRLTTEEREEVGSVKNSVHFAEAVVQKEERFQG